MENGLNHIGSAIQQHNVPSNQHISAIRRRRRQTPFQIFRARSDFLLESWRKGAALHKLPFQSRRQTVSLGEPGRKIALMAAIPFADSDTVLIPVIVVSPVVIVSVLVVTLTFSLPVALGQCATSAEH